MTREEKILRFISRDMRGIEVAPYHNPLASKSKGYNCLTLDIFDYEQLTANARKDPNVKDKVDCIENVDIVASATDIDEAVEKRGELGSFDYVLSSHNFEHLPNPIRFLKACGKVLKKQGLLTMAIPNKRFTFDYGRSLSSFVDFYRAYHESHVQPDPWVLFDFEAGYTKDVPSSEGVQGVPRYGNKLTEKFNQLKARLNGDCREDYIDAHVWVFTPESFVTIISDCMLLKLIPMSLVHVEVADFEFYVHFRNTGVLSDEDAHRLEERRNVIPAVAFRS